MNEYSKRETVTFDGRADIPEESKAVQKNAAVDKWGNIDPTCSINCVYVETQVFLVQGKPRRVPTVLIGDVRIGLPDHGILVDLLSGIEPLTEIVIRNNGKPEGKPYYDYDVFTV